MWPPATANAPAEPLTVPAVVVPSPQLMVAVKSLAVSLPLLSVNVATVVLAGSAVPSVAALSTTVPASCGAVGANVAK